MCFMDSNTTTSMETLTSPESSIQIKNCHRRSRLKSQTCRVLFQILTHCHDYSKSFPKSGDDIKEVGKTNEQEVHVELVGGDRVEDILTDESTKVNDVEDGVGGSNCVQKIMDELENMISGEGNEEVVVIDNCGNEPTVSVDDNQISHETIEFVDNQEHYFALEKILMEESEDLEKLPVDNELHMSKDVVSCLDRVLYGEVFEAGGNVEDTPSGEKNAIVETELQALQLNDIEINKSVCVIDKMASPTSNDGNEEIEEGEFFGELGLCDLASVELFDDLTLEEEKGIYKEQSSKDVLIKKMANFRELRQLDEQDAVSSQYNLDIADDMDSNIEYEGSEEMDILCTYTKTSEFSRIPVNGSKKNQDDGSKEALNLRDIALHEDYSEEYESNNGRITSAEKGAGLNNKKKRSGTAESKKKRNKKRKKKINDAGNNGAVKRFKILPELKPKAKKSCTHYLKGRCREGDKCPFSHDGVPITKSKPCVHFARNSCMNGDDCLFDHILSNYACENFVSKGSCHRGDTCKFSHEIPVTNNPPITSNACKHENVDTKLYPSKNTNMKFEETVLNPSAYSPKGRSFYSFKNFSLDDSCKLKQGDSSAEGNVKKWTPPAVTPKGIHLFSLEKSLPDNSTSMKQEVLSSNSENRNVMSVFYHPSKMKQIDSPLKAVSHIHNQREQITSGTVQNALEIPEKDSLMLVTPGINPFSLSKAPSDNSCINQKPCLAISKDNNVNISAIHKQCMSEKTQHSSPTPSMMSVSPYPSGQSLGRLSTLANSAQKALLSTLAFAAKYESGIKLK